MLTAATFELMGLQFDGVCEDDLIEHLVTAMADGRGGWMVNPNLDCLRLCMHDRELQQLVADADLVVPDGVPLVWAARLHGAHVPDRVAGSSLIWSLSRRAAEAGVGVFLLGGLDETMAAEAARRIATQAPGIRIGYHVPPFGFERDPGERNRIDAALAEFGPALVFCGLGFPKQERLMQRLAADFPSSWFLGAGASISFAAGTVERAPRWMQDRGLEWVYRLVVEPRRLAGRYLVHDLPFAARLFAWAARRRSRPVRSNRTARVVALPHAVPAPAGLDLRDSVDGQPDRHTGS
jgi:N-acetylglucosaminyldiphosphoundecaprenol N-acetyl-beta-D-mannosaminyltransferase